MSEPFTTAQELELKSADAVIAALRAELAAALQDAEDLNIEVEHYANLAIVDLGANPTVSWMERAEAVEAERDALRAELAVEREQKVAAMAAVIRAVDMKIAAEAERDELRELLLDAHATWGDRPQETLARIDAALKERQP